MSHFKLEPKHPCRTSAAGTTRRGAADAEHCQQKARVLFGKFHVLIGESAWFLARRDDAVVVWLLQGVATLPGDALAPEECIGIFQTGH